MSAAAGMSTPPSTPPPTPPREFGHRGAAGGMPSPVRTAEETVLDLPARLTRSVTFQEPANIEPVYMEKYASIEEIHPGKTMAQIAAAEGEGECSLKLPLRACQLNNTIAFLGGEKFIEDCISKVYRDKSQALQDLAKANMAETMKAGMDAAADVYIQEEIQASGGAIAEGPAKEAQDAELYAIGAAWISAAASAKELMVSTVSAEQERRSEMRAVVLTVYSALESGGVLCNAVDAALLQSAQISVANIEFQCPQCNDLNQEQAEDTGETKTEAELARAVHVNQVVDYAMYCSDQTLTKDRLSMQITVGERASREAKYAARLASDEESASQLILLQTQKAALAQSQVFAGVALPDSDPSAILLSEMERNVTRATAELEICAASAKVALAEKIRLQTAITEDKEMLAGLSSERRAKAATLLGVEFPENFKSTRGLEQYTVPIPDNLMDKDPKTARLIEEWLYKMVRTQFAQLSTLMGVVTLLWEAKDMNNPLRVPLVKKNNAAQKTILYFDTNSVPCETIYGVGPPLSNEYQKKYISENLELWDYLVQLSNSNASLRSLMQKCSVVQKSGGLEIDGQELRESSAEAGDGIGFIHWLIHYHETTVRQKSKSIRKVIHHCWAMFMKDDISASAEKVLNLLKIGREYQLKLDWEETIQLIALNLRRRSFAKFDQPMLEWIKAKVPYEHDCLDQFEMFMVQVQTIARLGGADPVLNHTTTSSAALAQCQVYGNLTGDVYVQSNSVISDHTGDESAIQTDDSEPGIVECRSTAENRWICCAVDCENTVDKNTRIRAEKLDTDYDLTHCVWCTEHVASVITAQQAVMTKSTAPGGRRRFDVRKLAGTPTEKQPTLQAKVISDEPAHNGNGHNGEGRIWAAKRGGNFQYKWISKNSGKESWCTESEFKKRELMIKQKTLHPTIQASAVQLQAQAAAAQTATEIAQAARIANLELQVGALAQEGMQRTEAPPPPPPPPVQSAQEKYIATILAKHSLS